MESTQVHIGFFSKNEKIFLKEHLEHLDFSHSWTYNPHKKYIYNCKYNKF